MKHEWPIETDVHPDIFHGRTVTRQMIWDVSLAHLRKQRARSPAAGPCFYEFADTQCPVRPLLGGYYVKAMEGYNAKHLSESYGLPPWFSDHLDLILGIQKIHDVYENWKLGWETMEMVLELYAADHNLEMTA